MTYYCTVFFLWFAIPSSFVLDYQHLCSSPCLLVCLSVCLPVCLFVCLSCSFVLLPVCLSCLSVLSVCLSCLPVLSVGVLGCDCRILMADFVLSIRRFLLLIIQLAIITTYVNSSNYLFTSIVFRRMICME